MLHTHSNHCSGTFQWPGKSAARAKETVLVLEWAGRDLRPDFVPRAEHRLAAGLPAELTRLASCVAPHVHTALLRHSPNHVRNAAAAAGAALVSVVVAGEGLTAAHVATLQRVDHAPHAVGSHALLYVLLSRATGLVLKCSTS